MEISSKKINTKNLKRNMAKIWEKYHMMLFYTLLLISILAGAYIWKISFSGSGWSQDRKQEYMNSQNKSVVLKERELKSVIEEIQKRKNEPEQQFQTIKDIFK